MIYIQKRTPSQSIIEEISQQKSSEEWKKLPEIPPKDKKEKVNIHHACAQCLENLTPMN